MRDRVIFVIPAFNEARTLDHILKALHKMIERSAEAIQVQILVVDDGSGDQTASIALLNGCKLIRHERNRGYGAALRSGFSFAYARRYDYVLTMDADGQHSLHDVLCLVRARKRGAVISGSRYLPTSRRVHQPPAPLVNGLFTELIKLTTFHAITDVGCGLKCIDASLFGDMRFRENGYLFPLEFWWECHKASVGVYEVPVDMIYPDSGRNLRAKFGSVERALDCGVFCLTRLLLQMEGGYTRSWGARLRACASTRAGLHDMQAIVREIFDVRWDELPLGSARRNLRQLFCLPELELRPWPPKTVRE